MKNTIKSVAVLTVIAVVCAALLTVTNYFWKVEEPQGITAELLSIFREMTDDESADFYELDIGGLGLDEKVKNAYKASAGNNQDIVIINAEGVAGSYGAVEMLTAIDTNTDKIIDVVIYKNDTDRKEQVINTDDFKDLDNSALQNTQIDIKSSATVTGTAMVGAVKLTMEQYAAKKQEILSAPAKIYDLLSVRIYLRKGRKEIDLTKDEIYKDDSIKIVIEVTSNNIKKANPEKVSLDVTVLRNGAKYTKYDISREIIDNKVIYTLTPQKTFIGSYQVKADAKIKNSTVKGDITFDVIKKEPIELKIIKKMFEGSTEVTVESEGFDGEVLFKNDLNNYIYAVMNEEYEYDVHGQIEKGVSNIFIAFDEEGKIDKIDGEVTNTIDFPVSSYLAKFKGKHASYFNTVPKRENSDIDVVSNATYTSDAIYDAVAKICRFYLEDQAGEEQ
jgi:Na+-translocating ferredoxin:NAD+ oxidoreductase RnfG subunit